jgi:TolB protein
VRGSLRRNALARRALALAAVATALLTGCGGERRSDPQLIVFARAPATNVFSDLYLLQTDGNLRRLTHGGIDSDPLWSPDGRRLAFQRTYKGKVRDASLYVANADGTGERLLPDTISGSVDWSPDGRRLLLVDSGRVLVTNEDASDRTLLLDPKPERAADARWSPDGTRIVYALGDDVHGDVWVMNADGTDRRRLTRLPAGAGFPDTPLWSLDGGRIAFLLPASLHVMNADGSQNRVLARFPNGIFPSTPAWSPDGRTIAFARLQLGRQRHRSGLYTADVDSGQVRRLTRDIDSSPSWSPDGRRLVFQRLTGFHISQITLVNRDGSDQIGLTRGGWSDSSPAWRPDNRD